MTTYKYTFYNGGFVGNLFIENDESAEKVANLCGATSFENNHTRQKYQKCIGCGGWFKADILTDGICPQCDYLDQMQKFINHCEDELNLHWDDKTELYEEYFTITFRGASLRLPFGAIEYNHLIDCLEDILKENQE